MLRLLVGLRFISFLSCAIFLSACAPHFTTTQGFTTVHSIEVVAYAPTPYYDLHVINDCHESLEVYIDSYYATTVHDRGVISGISGGQHEFYAEGYNSLLASRQIYFDSNHEWIVQC
ncbi:MAG: hypothetical protein ACRCYY_06645 [Trueperaceae bacterium]